MYQAHGRRFPRVNLATRQQQLKRPRLPYDPGEPLSPAIEGEHPHRAMGHPETRLVRRNPQVARQGQLEPLANGASVHDRDDGLLDVGGGCREPKPGDSPLLKRRCLAIQDLPPCWDRDAEIVACARNENHPDAVVLAQFQA